MLLSENLLNIELPGKIGSGGSAYSQKIAGFIPASVHKLWLSLLAKNENSRLSIPENGYLTKSR